VVVAVRVAMTARIHDPAHDQGKEDEGDESAEQRPVHPQNIYEPAPVTARRGVSRLGPALASGVQRDLLAGRGEGPGDL
jgi:hypothetical protein